MEQFLKGKTALVTGGARGIGQSIAEILAGYGADIVVLDLEISEEDEVIRNIRGKGVYAWPVKCNLLNIGEIPGAVKEVLKLTGKIDILVNNAGAYPAVPLVDVDEKHFDFVVGLNLKSLFFISKEVVNQAMLPAKYGRIVNISSCDGKTPANNVSIYSAAKAGVISLTKSFALELAGNDINSNAVAAGWVESKQVLSSDRWKDALPGIPSRRLGKLSEIAETVAFLCNDAVSYINGEIIDVNGGIIMD